jgi:hypothetical protein
MKQSASTPLSSTIFERIVNEARHPKSKGAIERIRNACDYLEQHRIPISVPEVGKLCEGSGPQAQSIRNNKLFRAYVDARRSEQIVPLSAKSKQDRYISNDVQANAYMRALEVQVSRRNDQNENLMRAIRDLGEFDLRAVLETGRLVRFKPQEEVNLDLTGLAKCLLDPSRLRLFGLVLQNERIIAPDRNNRVFLEKSEVEKLLKLKDASDKSRPRN